MVIHMKTTVEISPPILQRARVYAQTHKTTLRALIERGLLQVLNEKKRPHFKLRQVTYGKGTGGMHPEFTNKGWETIRDAIYEEYLPFKNKKQ